VNTQIQRDEPGQAARHQCLDGVRVADLTIITAGASATQILADFGADVIKVESGSRMDPFRLWEGAPASVKNAPQPWNVSPPFLSVNRNKRSLTLNLKKPEGREVFLRLVATSDAVVHNFRTGVMERLGLGVDELRRAKPDIVTVWISSQGDSGPESEYRSFGSTLDALSGLMSLTGYSDGVPVWSGQGVNYPDQIVSTFAAAAILVGLRQRDRTLQPVHIDLAQRELVTSMIGEAVLDYTVNGVIEGPGGNRDPATAPAGVYRCRGDDQWVSIAVTDDAQWQALARAMGHHDVANSRDYATVIDRCARADEIDELITGWTAERDRHEVMATLQAVGISAGAVTVGPELWDDLNLKHRGFYCEVDHPLAGMQRQRTWPFRLARRPGRIRRPAPLLGQHTTEILRECLGLTEAEVARLNQTGVTTSEPSQDREGKQ
jgi:crotonobetainyl-CoA:carnitine CoA-transferase CaiB-like acyl-CoA transferase